MRCFLAADLPAPVRDELGRLQERLRALGVEGRWVRADAAHLTVKFLGELTPETFAAVCAELPRVPLGPGPLRLRASRLGVFPSLSRARILWVGLDGDVERLARAAAALEESLAALGVPRETRPFRPHLTLARAVPPGGFTGLPAAVRELGGYAGPDFPVAELTLYRSELHRSGAVHTKELSIPLG